MFKRVSLKINNSDVFYYISFVIFLVVMISRQSFLAVKLNLYNEFIFKSIIILCLGLLFIKEFVKNRVYGIYIVYLGVIFFLAFIIKRVDAFTSSICLFFLFSARDIPFKKIATVAFYVTAFMLITILLLSQIGIITDYQFEMDSDRPRQFLGFFYALYAPAFLVNILLLQLYIRKDRAHIFTIILEYVLNLWIYKKTDSRLSYYLNVLLIMVTLGLVCLRLLKQTFGDRVRFINSLSKSFIGLCMVFSFIIVGFIGVYFNVNYNPNDGFQFRLNKTLSRRLEHGRESYKRYGVTFLGQKIEWVGNGLTAEGESLLENNKYLYVDNLYLQFLQRYGILFSSLFLISLTVSMYCMYKNKDWMLLFIFIIFAAHALIEDLVLYLWYNTFLLAMAQYIFPRTITTFNIQKVFSFRKKEVA